jgi:hypothetical protein
VTDPSVPAAVAAALSPEEVDVAPGGAASLTLTVNNTGTIVEGFEFEVLGECRPWAQVDPPAISLLPRDERTVTIHVHPPRAPIPHAGRYPLAVLVRPASRPAESVVVEGDVTVAPFSELAVQLRPVTSRGAWKPRHQVAVENTGNTEVTASISAIDPDDQLTFRVDPPTVTVAPGGTARARLRAQVRRVNIAGGIERKPFSVVVQDQTGASKRVDGAVSQRPVLARWVPRGAVVVAAAVIGGLVYANQVTHVHDQATAAPTTTTSTTATTLAPTTVAPATTTTPPTTTSAGAGAPDDTSVVAADDPCTSYGGPSGVQADTSKGTITLGGSTRLTIKAPGTAKAAAALAGHFSKLCLLGAAPAASGGGAAAPVQQAYVWLPAVPPLSPLADVLPTGCKRYDPTDVSVRDLPATGGAPAASSVVTGGTTVLVTLADHATALRVATLAQHHAQLCWIGATVSGSDNVGDADPTGSIEYWD